MFFYSDLAAGSFYLKGFVSHFLVSITTVATGDCGPPVGVPEVEERCGMIGA